MLDLVSGGFRAMLRSQIVVLMVVASLPSRGLPTSSSAGSHPDLTQLTSSNWTENISKGLWLVEFYSPYCSHCKAFLPLWKELAQNKKHLASDYPDAPFRMAQVNCFAQLQLCVDQEVPHFPKLTIYREGKREQLDYHGDREYTELAKWIDEQAQHYRSAKGVNDIPHPKAMSQRPASNRSPLPSELNHNAPKNAVNPSFPPMSQDSTPRPLDAHPPSEIAIASPSAGAPNLMENAEQVPAQSPDPIDESLPNPHGILLQYGITPGLKTLEELRDWLGLLPEDARHEGNSGSRTPQPSKAPVLTENANEGSEGMGSTQLGGGNGGAHLHTGILGGPTSSYDESSAALAPPFHGSPMSTRLPLRKDTTAKGGTFVKFYAPWCLHCKAMAKAFADLGPTLKNRLNILEVDCQANFAVCHAFSVTSYPTLRLYSPTNRLVSEYRGSRTFDAMRSWCDKAAEEEGVDLLTVDDEVHWADISRREEVRFLWLTDTSHLDVDRGVIAPSWEEERDLIMSSSKGLFTSPFRVYRTSHGALASRFQIWLGTKHSGFKSVLLAFKDYKADRPVAATHIAPAPSAGSDGSTPSSELSGWRHSERNRIAAWLDWNRYPTISQVGGDSWTDVINNRHEAPVVLALLSDEHHDGQTFATGSGSARREAEVAALRRMALAWRDSKRIFAHSAKAVRHSAAPSSSLVAVPANLEGGLLWGWIDADRWRKAISSYYSLKEASDFPALLLVDGSSLLWYPLPTLKPSELVDAATLDSVPGKLKNAVAATKPEDYGFKTNWLGVSLQISTWLGRGTASLKSYGEKATNLDEGLNSTLAVATSIFVDDLHLLDEIEAIGRGERRHLARSSRSYLDRGYRSLGHFVSWGAAHPVISTFLCFALLATLAVYVRISQAEHPTSVRGGGNGMDRPDAELVEKGAHVGRDKRRASSLSWREKGVHSAGTKVD